MKDKDWDVYQGTLTPLTIIFKGEIKNLDTEKILKMVEENLTKKLLSSIEDIHTRGIISSSQKSILEDYLIHRSKNI